MRKKILTPIQPGEVLELDFLELMSVSQYHLAKGVRRVSAVNEIVHGWRSITADTALERDAEVLQRSGGHSHVSRPE